MMFNFLSSLFLEALGQDLIFPITDTSVYVIVVLLLLFLVAVAAGAEVAFFTLGIKDINYLKTRKSVGSRDVIRLLEDPELLLSSLKASKYTLAIAITVLALYLKKLLLPQDAAWWVRVIIILSIAFLLILLGEVLPKVFARQNNVRLAIFSTPIVKSMYGIFRHPARLLLTDSVEYVDRKKQRAKLLEMNSKEFEDNVEISLGHTPTKEEVEIFRGILKFGNITAKQIMHPRLDIVAVREGWSFEKVREKALSSGYSRLPVYNSNIDEITGMVFSKDFLPYIDNDNFEWHELIRPAFFIPPHKLIHELLTEFQDKKVHFAIVVDEFGGTLGIVTLEDVMEEIIGDFRDEFDEDKLNFRKLDDNVFIFEGKMLLNDMCRAMGISTEKLEPSRGNSDSLGGFILEIAGRFPAVNERVQYDNIDFTILSVDRLRIDKVKAEIITPQPVK